MRRDDERLADILEATSRSQSHLGRERPARQTCPSRSLSDLLELFLSQRELHHSRLGTAWRDRRRRTPLTNAL